MNNLEKSKIFKALSNPIRLEIINILLEGEKCVCEITKALNNYEQPHISKSLSILKSANIIEDSKKGLKVYYKISMPCIKLFIECLNKK